MRALVADDSYLQRKIIYEFLSNYAHVTVVDDGQKAVQEYMKSLLSDRPLDLICLDIEMPVMNGQIALKNIRKLEVNRGIPEDERVKIIMITTRDDITNVVEAARSQCDGYLKKPYDESKLRDILLSLKLIR